MIHYDVCLHTYSHVNYIRISWETQQSCEVLNPKGNKSLKDRKDNKTLPYFSQIGDVYRFEITIGRDWIVEHAIELKNISKLKNKHFQICTSFEGCSIIWFKAL